MTTVANKKELHELGATEMAERIRDGSLSVIEIAEALIARIKKHDSAIQAFSYFDVEGILNEAKELDDEAKAGRFRGPLHGVPFGIKEQFLLEGIPTRANWTDPEPDVAEYTATVVERLRDSGALLLGKLYMTGPGVMPPTRNPFNIEHTPGGSSSGSGAAVGSRFVPFAMAEQSGGSGIRPAAYCGISALKPTFGRNPVRGMFIMSYSNDFPCIIATTIADVATIFAITSGYDPRDPTSLALPPAEPVIDVASMAPPRIGVVRNFFPELTSPEVNACIEASASKLAAAGAIVEDFMLPDDFGMIWQIATLIGVEGWTHKARERAEKFRAGETKYSLGGSSVTKSTHRYGTNTLGALGEILPATYYIQAQRIRRWLRDRTDDSMSKYDAILMATAPEPAPRDLTTSGDQHLCNPWSKLGNPAISIPGGLAANGMPIGLQFVAPTLRDENLLATGAWCQDVLGLLPVPELP